MLSTTQPKHLKCISLRYEHSGTNPMRLAFRYSKPFWVKLIDFTLTFAVCKVPYTENVIEILIVVLLNVRCFLRCVLKLHCDLFQVFVQLQNRKSMNCQGSQLQVPAITAQLSIVRPGAGGHAISTSYQIQCSCSITTIPLKIWLQVAVTKHTGHTKKKKASSNG